MDALIIVLATVYAVVALTQTPGPFGSFYRLQQIKWLPFHCYICTAPWAAAGCLMLYSVLPLVATALAVAGGVWILISLVDR